MPKKTTLEEAFEIENLTRAWRWLRSNPDAKYKSYFRELYSTYAIIDEWYLKDLSDRLKRGIYTPSHACKIYLPKPSGILRPYTLLTIEDQIVYQALVNIVAEKLLPTVKNKYYIESFGNLYAGKSSIWFYRKWTDSYKKFNDAARQAVTNNLKFSASFDLTACYDSLDHGVLTHFLKKIGCNEEFCKFLTDLLSTWTATEGRIYHHHGIPQGPLSSGLLSEVVLQYFDNKHRPQTKMRYLRYVDDIHLFASSPSELRLALIKLDLLSKDIGLFPQSSKIEIHEVKNIEQELKSVSNPTETSIKPASIDQKKIRARLIELSPKFKVGNPTRFKFILSYAEPSYDISRRLWRIYEQNPALYESILRYFSRYKEFPDSVANRFLHEIKSPQIYPMILASMIEVSEGRFNSKNSNRFHKAVKALWKPKFISMELKSAIGHWVIKYNLLKTPAQRSYALSIKGWYPRINTTRALDNDTLNSPESINLLGDRLKDPDNDIAIIAAFLVAKKDIQMQFHTNNMNSISLNLLGELGYLPKTASTTCGIEINFKRMLGKTVNINWKKIFILNYNRAEQQAKFCRAYAETNITAWVNAVDVFNDFLLNEIFSHDANIGSYTLGNIGSVLGSTSSMFAKKYPKIFLMAKEFHEKRGRSHLSHPIIKSSKKPTGPIKYSYLLRGKAIIKEAYTELLSKW